VVGGCELEVTNQMGGFAFFYPERFSPLRLYLFDPPEEMCVGDDEAQKALFRASLSDLYQRDRHNRQMIFRIPPQLYKTFSEWPWSRRPLHGYNFTFIPTSATCLVKVTARESSVVLDLNQEERL
jgi:hypothetical protein